MPTQNKAARPSKILGCSLAEEVSLSFIKDYEQRTKRGVESGGSVNSVLSADDVKTLLQQTAAVCIEEPALIELRPGDGPTIERVTVVGDTHGHFLDLVNMLRQTGGPSSDVIYIFNGDIVDRGPWGLEGLLLLSAYKILLPKNVYLVRGNHETKYCAEKYGFKAELVHKYGAAAKGKNGIFEAALSLFEAMPLAVLVQDKTLILHGGLWRSQPKGNYKKLSDVPAAVRDKLGLGSLAELRAACSTKQGNKRVKGGRDPYEEDDITQMTASDIIWSDPSTLPGVRPNQERNVGVLVGPDAFQEFMVKEGLTLLIRSHEGSDARKKRPDNDRLDNMDRGHTTDCDVVVEGTRIRLMTVFSAGCYPMHTPEGYEPYTNKAAVLHLTGPDYSTPVAQEFEAAKRPEEIPLFYTLDKDSYTKVTCPDTQKEDKPASKAHTRDDSTAAAAAPTAAAGHDAPSAGNTAAAEDAAPPASNRAAAAEDAALPPAVAAAPATKRGKKQATGGGSAAAVGSKAVPATGAQGPAARARGSKAATDSVAKAAVSSMADTAEAAAAAEATAPPAKVTAAPAASKRGKKKAAGGSAAAAAGNKAVAAAGVRAPAAAADSVTPEAAADSTADPAAAKDTTTNGGDAGGSAPAAAGGKPAAAARKPRKKAAAPAVPSAAPSKDAVARSPVSSRTRSRK